MGELFNINKLAEDVVINMGVQIRNSVNLSHKFVLVPLAYDREKQDYFVSLINWVKLNYEDETRKEMIPRRVPAKKISLRLTP